MKSTLHTLAIGIGLMIPLLAHHSFDAEYDRTKTQEFKGVVTKVEWMNPHARFYLDVKDAAGNVVNWNMELGSPNSLMRQGWKKDSLKAGDEITCSASLAKDGSKMGNARNVTLANGKRVFGASSADSN